MIDQVALCTQRLERERERVCLRDGERGELAAAGRGKEQFERHFYHRLRDILLIAHIELLSCLWKPSPVERKAN